MNCKVLVLSHGNLAGSLVDTVKLIFGSTDGIEYMNMPDHLIKINMNKILEILSRKTNKMVS